MGENEEKMVRLRIGGKNPVCSVIFFLTFREYRKEQRRRYYERIKQMERDSDTNNDDDHEDILSTKEIQEKGFDETLELPEETEQVPKSLIEKKNE